MIPITILRRRMVEMKRGALGILGIMYEGESIREGV